MKDLLEIRNEIDEVDRKILELFEYRMELTQAVARYKKESGKPIYDRKREEEKIASLKAIAKDKNNHKAVEDLFLQIMSLSRRLQYTLLDNFDDLGFTSVNKLSPQQGTKVAFYGEIGSYTEQAMLQYFSAEVDGISMGTFEEVMQAVKEGQVDYGVLPIENSSTGSVTDIYDLLADYDNYIIGEHVIKIEHCLWGFPQAKIEDIKRIYSHRQGLMQCSKFLKKHGSIEVIDGGSTAGCAKRIMEEADITQAAIASRRAGEYYGLKLLNDSIHNEDNNSTRFIIITNRKIFYKEATRTGICFTLPHRSGALYHMLSYFIYNNINMTRIESRPIPGKTFEYRFFVDIEGSLMHPSVKNALHCIKQEASDVKILGSYIHGYKK